MILTRATQVLARRALTSRGFSTNPFPAGSMLYSKFETCLDKATESGVDLFAEYSPFLPVDLMQNTMITLESLLPFGGWPLAIAATAVLSRSLLFPIQLWSMRKSQSNQTVMKEMEQINKNLKRASEKADSKATSRLQDKYNALVAEHGRFFAFKGMVGSLLPIPLFMMSFSSLRGLAEHPHLFPSFALQDPLWLDSLALPDPYFILPCISAGLFLTNLELTGRLDSAAGSSAADVRKGMLGEMGAKYGNVLTDDFLAKIKKYGLRGVVVSSLYFTTGFPSACFFFFIPNTLLAITQNRLLRNEAIQLRLGLRPVTALATSTAPSTSHLKNVAEFVKTRKAERKQLLELQSLKEFPMKAGAVEAAAGQRTKTKKAVGEVLKARPSPQTVKELLAAAKEKNLKKLTC